MVQIAPPTLPGLGPVKPNVRSCAQAIAGTFGITNIGGFATSGHMPGSDHYRGLAIDVMISSVAQGNSVARWAQMHASDYSITYVIWNRRIWSVRRSAEGWRPYVGASPHTDHVHISFSAAGTVTNPATAISSPGVGLGEAMGALTAGGTWLRVGAFIGGLALILLLVWKRVMT